MSNSTTPKERETLQQLLERLGIDHDKWDMFLVGDGSGSKWGYPIGWGCVALYPDRMDRKVYYGGMNDGTVNVAEAMAYMAPLTEFARDLHEKAKAKKQRHVTANVHILTDSAYTRQRGEQGAPTDYKRNSFLFRAYDMFSRQGIFLHWHHLKREDAELNRYADVLSKAARAPYKAENLQIGLLKDGWATQDCNPWE